MKDALREGLESTVFDLDRRVSMGTITKLVDEVEPEFSDEIKSREITFVGFREKNGKPHCLVSASQIWSDEFYAKLRDEHPGKAIPRGSAMRLLVPLEDVMMFFEDIKRKYKEYVESR